MATGDQNDILGRLQAVLPSSWFNQDGNPIRDALLAGLANGHGFVYSAIQYVKGQTRIKTASEGFLDLVSQDFFGGALPRETNESDGHFLLRIQVNLLRERATRHAVQQILYDLTGNIPTITEPTRCGTDVGAYGSHGTAYGVSNYGSMVLPYQAFVVAYRPPSQGIPFVGGYGSYVSAYGNVGANNAWMDMSQAGGVVTDADIYAAVASVLPEGTIGWVNLQNQVNAPADLPYSGWVDIDTAGTVFWDADVGAYVVMP